MSIQFMNILFIGNSFSEDATRYLTEISSNALFVRNLYIGGCSLENHAKNFIENNQAYQYQKDAVSLGILSIKEALLEKEWDFVSLQQCSALSGVERSYEPHMEVLIQGIRKLCPNAKIVFHRTWAYEDFATHPAFSTYEKNRKLMFSAIERCSSIAAKRYGLKIIPTGDAIELSRQLPAFSGEKIKITRDGYHLSLDYGRYLAGLVCYSFFTGKSAETVAFEPYNTDSDINNFLKQIADRVMSINAYYEK